MAKRRASERDLAIPLPANIERRLEAESNPQLWLDTYFRSVFSEDWTADRLAMLHSIIDAALYGGDQAIAGPRGEGKTTIATHAALYLMVRKLSTFPVVIGKSQGKAQLELKAIKEQLQQNELFLADYPEIGVPMQAVGGWSSRARMQTVGGMNTNIELAADHIAFPTIARWQLADWPESFDVASCGQVLYSLGIDGPVRGTKFRNSRPTLAIIDDIEDREAAASEALIEKNDEIIEKDVAGLGASSERVPRVMLCTVQNRKCIAYRFTDPQVKPSWRGKRYRKMLREPDRIDLVQQYISMRQARAADDPDARLAFAFWRDNQTDIEAGCEVSNPNSYSKKLHSDGEPLELSAIHAYYNRVADVGPKAVATEIDNDPPPEVGPLGSGLTSSKIMNQLNQLKRQELPENTVCLTAGIDIGKYRCHWTITAWVHGAAGCVIDYGVLEVSNTQTETQADAIEWQIYRALIEWRDQQTQKQYKDKDGNARNIDFVLIDSGNYNTAIYEFTKQVGGIYHPAKGINPYRQKKSNGVNVLASEHLHAQKLDTSGIWLYELDTNYWKQFVHERFLTPVMDEANNLKKGSLSLFAGAHPKSHLAYANHIVAEELVTEFKEGKGSKTYWLVKNENNHWLDATYLACAAAEIFGVKLLAPAEKELTPRVHNNSEKEKLVVQNAKAKSAPRFKQRPGGWIPRRRT